jgi:hypothetical protein
MIVLSDRSSLIKDQDRVGEHHGLEVAMLMSRQLIDRPEQLVYLLWIGGNQVSEPQYIDV